MDRHVPASPRRRHGILLQLLGEPEETVGLVRVRAIHLGYHGSFSPIEPNPGGIGW